MLQYYVLGALSSAVVTQRVNKHFMTKMEKSEMPFSCEAENQLFPPGFLKITCFKFSRKVQIVGL